jgi:regulation of enolase protein 1 (concanavalin A-like superfamily)
MCKKLLYLVLLILVLGLAPVSEAQTIDSSLDAWWRLDEGSGTTASDASGAGNTGTLNGGAAWTAGVSKTGVYLDGIDDFIEVPVALTETGTIGFWFKPDWNGTDPDDYRIFDASLGGIYFFISKGADEANISQGEIGFYLEDASDADYQGIEFDPAGVVFADTWFHLAVTYEFDGGSAILYFNGEEVSRAENLGGFPALDSNPHFGFETFAYIPQTHGAMGVIDEIMIYSRALAAEEIPLLMVTAPAELATDPSPADEAIDIPRDLTLGWMPGEFAVKHDVYLGTSADDVNNASRANPLDVLISQGQDAESYDAGRLELGQTYYWRIDEVNGAPDNTIFMGEVWSFTVEPLAYPIQNIIATSNAVSETNAGPEKAVDGSGLNESGEHSTTAFDMWLGSPSGADAVYVQYEFGQVYKLHEMLVWNYNVQFELFLGYGLRDITVEYSENGVDWIVLGDVELAQATARSDYTHSTTVEFGGVAARAVRLTVNSGWGPLGQFGLSEVRFMQIPAHAREPQPADGTTKVDVNTVLNWRNGREAATHEVYLSTDSEAVASGMALVDTVGANSYASDDLEFGTTYYWKINEVNETEVPSVWPGGVWSFMTQEYATIDDFESYDDEDNAIYETWIDGWVNETGSTVGYLQAPFAEQTVVNSGSQSMPLQYDNGVVPMYSEAEKDLGGMDLDSGGAETLRLFVSGQAPAFGETADGTVLMNAIGADIWDAADEFRYAYKNLTGDGSMIARVDALDGSPSTWAKAGVMVRQNTEAGAINTFIALTGGDGDGATFQQRLEADGTSVSQYPFDGYPFAPPYWVRLERAGNDFSAFISADGETWQQAADTVSVPMADPVLIGLALTSHNVDQSTGAAFSNISTTGDVSGTWQVAEVGVAQPTTGNAIEPLYVALEDTAGKVVVITHPNPAAIGISSWQEWLIPYSELTGINLSSVQTMYIGVGDRDNPTSGGTGTVFIDDIGFGRPTSMPVEDEVALQ